MIRYYKLFDLLFRRNIKLSELRKILSSATIAKLHKGEYISADALDKLCEFLNCQPEDIIEHYRILEKDKHEQQLIAIKTTKEIDEYGEEIPNGIFVKSITEPLNENGHPISGWYEKELIDNYNNLDYFAKCELDYNNALLNKNIQAKLDDLFNKADDKRA